MTTATHHDTSSAEAAVSVFTQKQREAARRAISLNLPFALFAPVGEEFRFYASMPDDEHGSRLIDKFPENNLFFAAPFAAPFGLASVIPANMTDDDVLALPANTEIWEESGVCPERRSTPYPLYYAALRKARAEIRRHKYSKLVISRLIAERSTADPVDVAEKYFASMPGCFRAIFFSSETGLWITATPELLLSQTAIPDEEDVFLYESMALAGTRSAGASGEWDDKNVTEHDIVDSYVSSHFRKAGLEVEDIDSEPVRFGRIEHKLHLIRGKGNANVLELLDEMSPTPALSGAPMIPAIRFIGDNEFHNRQCYGGNVGYIDENTFKAYVNIRCALVENEPAPDGRQLYNLYAGGGIMADSEIAREWEEAANKALPLYSIISPETPDSIFAIPEPWSEI